MKLIVASADVLSIALQAFSFKMAVITALSSSTAQLCVIMIIRAILKMVQGVLLFFVYSHRMTMKKLLVQKLTVTLYYSHTLLLIF